MLLLSNFAVVINEIALHILYFMWNLWYDLIVLDYFLFLHLNIYVFVLFLLTQLLRAQLWEQCFILWFFSIYFSTYLHWVISCILFSWVWVFLNRDWSLLMIAGFAISHTILIILFITASLTEEHQPLFFEAVNFAENL